MPPLAAPGKQGFNRVKGRGNTLLMLFAESDGSDVEAGLLILVASLDIS
jgi:hypothetical protein